MGKIKKKVSFIIISIKFDEYLHLNTCTQGQNQHPSPQKILKILEFLSILYLSFLQIFFFNIIKKLIC